MLRRFRGGLWRRVPAIFSLENLRLDPFHELQGLAVFEVHGVSLAGFHGGSLPQVRTNFYRRFTEARGQSGQSIMKERLTSEGEAGCGAASAPLRCAGASLRNGGAGR